MEVVVYELCRRARQTGAMLLRLEAREAVDLALLRLGRGIPVLEILCLGLESEESLRSGVPTMTQESLSV